MTQTASRNLRDTKKAAGQEQAETNRLPISSFAWGAGIECSFLPHLNVDQFNWTQHDRYWREDFRRLRDEVGLSYLRYAFPWHKIETEPGKFAWSYVDERMEEIQKLGIELMLDVMHFGTPRWLAQGVGDPEFPESLERFCQAMCERYGAASQVRTWCPCNEPLVCALFSGDFGFWPPHARKWHGYMPVLSRVVQGVSRGIRAIRRALPEATVLLCDAAENYKTREPSLHEEVARRNARRFVVMDLLTGRVNEDHPLHAWMKGYGISELDMEWFRTHPQQPDILGMDYYPHSDWQLDSAGNGARQRRADNPVGLYGIGLQYYQRYGIPLMLTETSIEGSVANREMWFDVIVEHISRLRAEGIPMLGAIWWPLLDQIYWDRALTHRIGKIHEVGLFHLTRQSDGSLARTPTSMVKIMRDAASHGEERVGQLNQIVHPTQLPSDQEQGPPLGDMYAEFLGDTAAAEASRDDLRPPTKSKSRQSQTRTASNGNGNGNGNGHSSVAGLAAEPVVADSLSQSKSTDRYGIVVFSHLRWGFVWQRPQQFLSRFAKKHKVLFIEEPFFDRKEGEEPNITYHRVMPNVIVVAPHVSPSWNRNPKLPQKLREFTLEAMKEMNDEGEFDSPLLWYYSPMDSSWSLAHIPNRGIVYDAMDELSQFSGAPPSLIANEKRLMQHADILFTGGYELWTKKKQSHENVHFFGCGVEFDHFAKAQDESTTIPPDIDFMARPILGWFCVIDERVDYGMVGEMARMRPDWSFAMVGPVVKVDPNLLPHSPNLYWLGGRDYQVLPNYCRAFDICMMPFAINAATQYINPTKALEYFATGRPVISTPIADVVRQYTDLVDIVKNADEFITAAEKRLNQPDPARIERAIEKARNSSWESTVDNMQRLIKEAIAPDRRKNKKAIKPLDMSEEDTLSYQYQATQGS